MSGVHSWHFWCGNVKSLQFLTFNVYSLKLKYMFIILFWLWFINHILYSLILLAFSNFEVILILLCFLFYSVKLFLLQQNFKSVWGLNLRTLHGYFYCIILGELTFSELSWGKTKKRRETKFLKICRGTQFAIPPFIEVGVAMSWKLLKRWG